MWFLRLHRLRTTATRDFTSLPVLHKNEITRRRRAPESLERLMERSINCPDERVQREDSSHRLFFRFFILKIRRACVWKLLSAQLRVKNGPTKRYILTEKRNSTVLPCAKPPLCDRCEKSESAPTAEEALSRLCPHTFAIIVTAFLDLTPLWMYSILQHPTRSLISLAASLSWANEIPGGGPCVSHSSL